MEASPNILWMIISFLVICLIFGLMIYRMTDWGRNIVDKFDKSETVVKAQKRAISWLHVVIWLIFGMPLGLLFIGFGTAIWQELINKTPMKIEVVDHVFDALLYGFKWAYYTFPAMGNFIFDDVWRSKPEVSNTWSSAFVFSIWNSIWIWSILWTWWTFDNKWGKIKKFIFYLGSVFFTTLVTTTFLFNKTVEPLPKAQIIEFIAKTVWKDAALTGAVTAPVTYGHNGNTAAAPGSSEIAGIPILYLGIGFLILLVIVILLLLRRKKSGQSAPASAGQPKAAAGGGGGDASTTATSSGPTEQQHTPQHESKKYGLPEFMLDKDALRRLIVLFRQYDPLCFYMLDVSKIYDMLNRMQAFLLTVPVHSDSFHATDNKEIDSLRSLVSSNIAGHKLPTVPGTTLDPTTYNSWASFMGQVMGAYSDGFHMRAGGYGAAVNNLGQYRKALAAQADVELKMIPANITNRKDPAWNNYNQLTQMIAMVTTWIAQLTAAYKPHYGEIQVPGVNVAQPPGVFATLRAQYPRQTNYVIIGIVGLLALLLIWFFFLRGGSKSSEESGTEVQTEQVQAAPQLSEKEFKRQKKILNTNLDLIVESLCAGQPAPPGAKEAAMAAAAKLGATKEQLNDEVKKRKAEKCPTQTQQKE